ncbi:protein kinase domain-containing protein [Streptomyces sp. GLT-R25]
MLDRPVAVKELHILTHGDEEHRIRVRRTIREARAVARVPHPHVVGVHDLVESEDRLWIVMELVQGPSLARHLAEYGPLTPQHTANLGLQLLDALVAVHAAGTLHRDVKPANVLLRRDGSAVLTDFGIAVLDDGEFLTTTGELIGSLEFMAPERVMGSEVGPASDLWSLGATLATVCGGLSPFRRPARPATLHAVAYQEPALSERLGPLRPVIEALLRKSPDERPTAASTRDALHRVAAGHTDAGALLPSPTAHASWPAPLLADADTMTSGRQGLVPTGQNAPTATHTTSLRPTPRPSSRHRGAKRLLWAMVGTAVLAAGVGGGLFLTGSAAAQEGPRHDDHPPGREVHDRLAEGDRGARPARRQGHRALRLGPMDRRSRQRPRDRPRRLRRGHRPVTGRREGLQDQTRRTVRRPSGTPRRREEPSHTPRRTEADLQGGQQRPLATGHQRRGRQMRPGQQRHRDRTGQRHTPALMGGYRELAAHISLRARSDRRGWRSG